MRVSFPFVALAVLTLGVSAVHGEVQWPMRTLLSAPETYDASEYATNEVKTVFYRGLDYRGKPTRVFAYYGLPAQAKGTRVPAMVLVHGGGGSAFVRWVKFWNARGYAAISMDTCGCVSGNTVGNEQRGHVRHVWAGPAGWGRFEAVDEPVADQWMYHAVADVVLANSFLRSLPEVDPDRIGLTGVSWGAVITCIAASVDDRFKFAAPVYGCGNLFATAPEWAKFLKAFGAETARKWTDLWDPVRYLPKTRVPVSWLVGTNDSWFSLPAVMKSHDAAGGDRSLSIRVRLSHAHSPVSEQAPETLALADRYLRGGPALPQFGEVSVSHGRASAALTQSAGRRAVSATLDYTVDDVPADGLWFARFWCTAPAAIEGNRVTADLPPGTKAFYLNVETAEKARSSSVVFSVKK